MGSVVEYYIVPKPIYDKCNAKEETLDEKIEKLPKSSQVKVKKILGFLPEKIKNSEEYSSTLFDYINYASRGKNKPSGWEAFLPNLVNSPSSGFCKKVQIEIKKYKRKHGTTIH